MQVSGRGHLEIMGHIGTLIQGNHIRGWQLWVHLTHCLDTTLESGNTVLGTGWPRNACPVQEA